MSAMLLSVVLVLCPFCALFNPALLFYPFVISELRRPRADAKAVICNGDGLTEGVVGEPAVFTIDTSTAGAGDLDVKIRGPRNPIDVHPMEIGWNRKSL